MEIQTLIEILQTELAQVEKEMTSQIGANSMCDLQKKNQISRSLKYLEGQQLEFRGVLKQLHTAGEIASLNTYLDTQKAKHEKMRSGPLGTAPDWQEYIKGGLDVLARVEELVQQE